jgi:hypothetical protein
MKAGSLRLAKEIAAIVPRARSPSDRATANIQNRE